jgi:nickel-dependent lactate racemase
MRLCYGQKFIELELTDTFQVILPDELPAANLSEIERAIDMPSGNTLEDLEGRSASIIISDITRPSPTHKMLMPLYKRLENLGISRIKVVFALGSHRKMTSEEELFLLKDCFDLPHRQHDMKSCIYFGQTSSGTPVEILEDVAASDIIIGTGNIEYHYYAGYSGGAKALLPGVSSERSIIKNHELMRDPRSVSGNVNSPVRHDMEEAAEIVGLDFILNVVLNRNREIVKAVAGNFIDAHRSGVQIVDKMYRRSVEPAEIIITCAGGRPKDINLFQAHKALDNAKGAIVDGGTIILLAECIEGYGNPAFERWANEASCAEDCLERFGHEFEFGGHKAALIAKESLKHDLILVSSMSKNDTEKAFFKYAKNLDHALAMARERHGKDARIMLLPHGDLTLATAK